MHEKWRENIHLQRRKGAVTYTYVYRTRGAPVRPYIRRDPSIRRSKSRGTTEELHYSTHNLELRRRLPSIRRSYRSV